MASTRFSTSRGQVGHHLGLEVLAEALLAQQLVDAHQAQPLLEEGVAAALEVEEDLLDVRETEQEVPLQVGGAGGQVRLHRLQGVEVVLEDGQASLDEGLRLRQHAPADAEGVLELEPESLGLVEGGGDPRLEGGEPARLEGGVVAGQSRAQGPAGRDREDLRREAEGALGLLAHEVHDAFDVFGRFQQVDLVHHHDDLLPPGPDRLEEAPLALGEGPVGGGDEEDEVRPRDELAGELLVLPQDRVGAGGVHDHDVPQDLGGGGEALEAGRGHLSRGPLPVAEQADAGGGGRDPFLEHLLPQQGVDEGALAGVELPHHDQEEGLLELRDGVGQGLALLLGGSETHEPVAQLGQEPAFVGQEGAAGLVEGRDHRAAAPSLVRNLRTCSRGRGRPGSRPGSPLRSEVGNRSCSSP